MKFIILLFVLWIGCYIPDWVGAIIAAILFVFTVIEFIRRIVTHQKLEFLSTLQNLIIFGILFWMMMI